MGISCPICGYSFKRNAPGVDVSEQPYFTHRKRDSSTEHICSTKCMEEYIKQENMTWPKEMMQ